MIRNYCLSAIPVFITKVNQPYMIWHIFPHQTLILDNTCHLFSINVMDSVPWISVIEVYLLISIWSFSSWLHMPLLYLSICMFYFEFVCVLMMLYAVWYQFFLADLKIWAHSQYKDKFFQIWGFHQKDETVIRSSHLYNGNPLTSKTASLHWNVHWNPVITVFPILGFVQLFYLSQQNIKASLYT